jgi:Tfp pilus assembly protein FimV
VRALRRGEVMVPGSRDDQRGQGGLATGDIASAGGGIAPVLRAEPVGPARPGAGVRAVSPRRYAVRRAGAAAVLGGLSLLVVVALGSVAEASSAARARASVPAGTATVAVQAGDTVWEVARRAAPTADPAAVVERIVADNGLGGPGAGVLPAGMVLRVPA